MSHAARLFWLGFALLSSFALLSACSAEKERAPALEGGDRPDGVRGGVGDNVGAGGAAGAPSTPSTPVTITGDVVQYADETFEFVALFNDRARVETFGADDETVSTLVEANESFELPGVLRTRQNWLSVAPERAGTDAMRTLHFADTSNSRDVGSVALARPSALATIYDGLAQPTSIDQNAGHLVVFFEDEAGTSVSGVSIDAPDAEVFAYSYGLFWSDALDATAAEGAALAGNLPASEYPGDSVDLSISGPVELELPLRVARGAVTIVLVTLPL